MPPFESEGIPLVSSYAALQDWDGLIFYTFEHEEPGVWDTAVPNTHLLNLAMDPVKIAQLAAFGVMFKRGLLRPATECVVRGYDEAQLIEGIRAGPSTGPLFTEGFSSFLPLLHRTRIRSFDHAITTYPSVDDTRDLVSDTGQLAWHNQSRPFVEVAAPQMETLVGYTGAPTPLLRHCDFKPATDFAALTLVALDNQPIARASRLLLVTAGKCELTDAQWNDAGWKLLKRGSKPTRIEAIRGELTLRGLERAAQIVVEPLDGAGNPLTAHTVPATNGTARLTLGDDITVWYLLTVSR